MFQNQNLITQADQSGGLNRPRPAASALLNFRAGYPTNFEDEQHRNHQCIVNNRYDT